MRVNCVFFFCIGALDCLQKAASKAVASKKGAGISGFFMQGVNQRDIETKKEPAQEVKEEPAQKLEVKEEPAASLRKSPRKKNNCLNAVKKEIVTPVKKSNQSPKKVLNVMIAFH